MAIDFNGYWKNKRWLWRHRRFIPRQRCDLNASHLRYFRSVLVLVLVQLLSFYLVIFSHPIAVVVDCVFLVPPPLFLRVHHLSPPRSGHKCMTRGLAAHIKEEGDSRLLYKKDCCRPERGRERDRGGERGRESWKTWLEVRAPRTHGRSCTISAPKGVQKAEKPHCSFNSAIKQRLQVDIICSISVHFLPDCSFISLKKKRERKENPQQPRIQRRKNILNLRRCIDARPSCFY